MVACSKHLPYVIQPDIDKHLGFFESIQGQKSCIFKQNVQRFMSNPIQL